MVKPKILVVDDEESMRRFFALTLNREGYQVETAEGVSSAVALIKGDDFDLVLCDIRLQDGQGLEVLSAARNKDPDLPVLMMTAYASAESAVEAMKLGANDYLSKPFNVDEVRIVVKNHIRTRALVKENQDLKSKLESAKSLPLIYQSRAMEKIIDCVKRVARMDTTVLVTGESGTGKELIMKAIHTHSARAKGSFVSVNCGALPETLFESELFGYEKGAFTGADNRKIGLFESANGGTLFLDEVGEMPLRMQIKLLRALQEKKIRRVGGMEELPVDVRLVAATNRDLQKEVKNGTFREDLYYRLNVIPIELPPLRYRREDILPLTNHFLDKFAKKLGEPIKEFSHAAFSLLEQYNWPGNIRELEHVIERLVAMAPSKMIQVDDLPSMFLETKPPLLDFQIYVPPDGLQLEDLLDDIRMRFMEKSLEMTNGVQTKSCELLGMSFRSFRYYYGKLRGREESETS